MARNPGTRIGRPPKINMPTPTKLPSGERQGYTPSSVLDTAYPAKAFPRNGAMPKYHDDPKMGFNQKRR